MSAARARVFAGFAPAAATIEGAASFSAARLGERAEAVSEGAAVVARSSFDAGGLAGEAAATVGGELLRIQRVPTVDTMTKTSEASVTYVAAVSAASRAVISSDNNRSAGFDRACARPASRTSGSVTRPGPTVLRSAAGTSGGVSAVLLTQPRLRRKERTRVDASARTVTSVDGAPAGGGGLGRGAAARIPASSSAKMSALGVRSSGPLVSSRIAGPSSSLGSRILTRLGAGGCWLRTAENSDPFLSARNGAHPVRAS